MKFILRKILTLIITLFIVSLLAFLAFQVIPGSPATSMLGTNATPEAVAELEAELGLDDPVLVRYARWVGDFVQGDWGTSYSYSLPVKGMVLEKLPATATLVLLGFAITVAASFPIGIATAKRAGGKLTGPSRCSTRCACPSRRCLWASCCASCSASPCGCLSRQVCHLWGGSGGFLLYMLFPCPGGGPVPDCHDGEDAPLLHPGRDGEGLHPHRLQPGLDPGGRPEKARPAQRHDPGDRLFLGHRRRAGGGEHCGGAGLCRAWPGAAAVLSSIGSRDFPVAQAVVILLATWVVVVNFIADVLYQYMDPRIRIR